MQTRAEIVSAGFEDTRAVRRNPECAGIGDVRLRVGIGKIPAQITPMLPWPVRVGRERRAARNQELAGPDADHYRKRDRHDEADGAQQYARDVARQVGLRRRLIALDLDRRQARAPPIAAQCRDEAPGRTTVPVKLRRPVSKGRPSTYRRASRHCRLCWESARA